MGGKPFGTIPSETQTMCRGCAVKVEDARPIEGNAQSDQQVGAVAKENDMRIVIYILMVLCALLVILCYSLCVIASEADRRADRMYRKWREEHDEGEQTISDR